MSLRNPGNRRSMEDRFPRASTLRRGEAQDGAGGDDRPDPAGRILSRKNPKLPRLGMLAARKIRPRVAEQISFELVR